VWFMYVGELGSYFDGCGSVVWIGVVIYYIGINDKS